MYPQHVKKANRKFYKLFPLDAATVSVYVTVKLADVFILALEKWGLPYLVWVPKILVTVIHVHVVSIKLWTETEIIIINKHFIQEKV